MNKPQKDLTIFYSEGKIAALEFSKTNSYTILHLFFQPRFKQAQQKLVRTQKPGTTNRKTNVIPTCFARLQALSGEFRIS
jgi:hypothetical protein